MNMKKLASAALISSAMGLIAAPAMSVTADGDLGATSTGTVDINLTLAPLIKISGLTDIDLAYTPGSGAAGSDTNVCVYTNGAATYNLTTSSANGGATAYQLDHATLADTIAYTVAIDTTDIPVGSTGVDGLPANTSAIDCSAGALTVLNIDVAQTEIDAAAAGAYSDTLTLVVSPL